jgi:DNA-binding transcriptional LysR family regulator
MDNKAFLQWNNKFRIGCVDDYNMGNTAESWHGGEVVIMHDLNDLLFFTAVVEQGGFSAAARALNLPKSSVSRRVGRLEARLGVRLLERSTRSVRLTDVGNSYYSRCRVILADLELADRNLAELRADPIGIIRVSCPTGMTQYTMARIVPSFMARYPLVRVQVVATNRRIDLIEDNIDVAIRARTRPQDEALTMRRLGSSRLIFVASPSFAATRAIPSDPADLGELPFLSFEEEAVHQSWTLTGPDGSNRVVSVDPILWTSDFYIVVEAACAGLGITLLPAEVVDRPIREGRLVRILPGWHSEDVTIHLVFTTRRGLAPAVRVFIDHLVEQFEVVREECLKL